MKNVGIYLTFDGKCKEAFDFYKGVFGGEFGMVMTYGDSCMKDETPADLLGKIMHMSLPIGNKFDLMGSDIHPIMKKEDLNMGNHVSISVSPENKKEGDRIFAALTKKGGKAEMPMADQFWGSYFGTCVDPYGFKWMIDCPTDVKFVVHQELALAAKALYASAEESTRQAKALEKLMNNMEGDAESLEHKAKKAKVEDFKAA